MRSPFIALVAIFLLGCGSADAPTTPSRTFTLSGVVRDARSNEPLTGAQVEIVSGANTGLTAAGTAAGSFSFAGIQTGSVVLRVSVDGYVAVDRPIEITANTVVDVALIPAPRVVVPPPDQPAPSSQVRTVSGQVTDKPIGGGIGGARVEILSGVNRGTFVQTNDNGFYQSRSWRASKWSRRVLTRSGTSFWIGMSGSAART